MYMHSLETEHWSWITDHESMLNDHESLSFDPEQALVAIETLELMTDNLSKLNNGEYNND